MPLYNWYLLSVILFLAEALAIPGIGLFFAAFGALSVALLVQLGLLPDVLAQFTAFFFLTGLWAAALWVPLKKFRIKRLMKSETHHDVIGRSAIVAGNGLQKGARGTAQWSGALMSAKLADDAALDEAAAGTELKIVAIEGSTLILATKDYPVNNTIS